MGVERIVSQEEVEILLQKEGRMMLVELTNQLFNILIELIFYF